MSPSLRPWRRIALATALCLAATPVLTTVPAFAAPAVSQDVAIQGTDWSVTPVPGGYQVTKTLAEPIELRGAAPTLWADGVDLGIAQESLDGLTLTVTTSDPAVASATSIAQGWDGEGDPTVAVDAGAADAGTPAQTPQTLAAPILADDPATPGQYAVERVDYDLGDEAEVIRGFGRNGEMRAAVFMPVGATGERPVVMFLHGRHTSCSGGTRNPNAWPCNPDQIDVASYLGYNASAEALASQGYAVVSISANAINALDGTLSDDNGAVARGQLVLDHLEVLKEADAGTAPEGVSASLKGRLDLDHVGLMGHSRGGDGVVRAALLNAELPEPFGIESVLPLAPTDFGRMTLPDVPMAVILPYCDGDVSNLQGQHFFDDSRHAYGDDVLRSSLLVMGTDHNFFNTSWTPSKYPYSSSDDWAAQDRTQTNPVCGYGTAPARLTDDEQYAVGTAYISGFFRLTMGGENQFLPMFDGSDAKPVSAGRADVRVSASLPASLRSDINNFDVADNTVRVLGAGTYAYCESLANRPVPGVLAPCASAALATSQVPDYTPANFAQSVPATTALRFTYTAPASGTAAAGQLRVPTKSGAKDFTSFEKLSFRVSPDETVVGSTDLTVSLADSKGGVATVTASSFGDALTVLPGTATPLRKLLLQDIAIPLTAFTGVDLTDVQEVRFTAPRAAGGVLLSDLSVIKPATIGTAKISTRPTLSIPDVNVEEGSGVGTVDVPVVLSRAQDVSTTAYFSAVGTAGGKVDLAMQKLTFAPGQVCIPVEVPMNGDTATSGAQSASFKVTVANTQEGSTIGDSFAYVKVREDDGVVTGGQPAPLAPAVGVQGDACAEALATPGALTLSDDTVNPGDTVTVTGSGFRVGESVSLTLAGAPVGDPVISTDGTVSFEVVIPTDAAFGQVALAATGAGSAFTSTADLTVAILVDRIAGEDRYAASVAASKAGFPDGAGTVFIASGESFPDALSAAPAAAAADAPILLTQAGTVSSGVLGEVGRLDPDSIVIVGGENTVSPAVEAALGQIAPVERLQGADRYATSRAIAEAAFGAGADTAVLATGTNFPDALSAGSAVAGSGPVLLVDGSASGLDAATTELLTGLEVSEIAIAGGEGSVSAGIQTAAAQIASTVRLAGADRYASSRAINAHFFTSADRVLLATGEKFPDALAGSALAPKLGAPLFTVPGSCVPEETLAQITALGARQVTLLGGVNTLTDAVENLTPCTAG